jgi:phosphatidylglycerophosphatase A
MFATNFHGMECFAHFMGLPGSELVLIAVVALVLFGGNKIPGFRNSLGKGIRGFKDASDEVSKELGSEAGAHFSRPVADALTTSNTTAEDTSQPAPPRPDKLMNPLILWLAQGFGVGRVPFAPGTFGSLAGVLWFLVLLIPQSVGFFVLGVVASVALSVWCCGKAEQLLKQKDPGSVVLDEIIAIPVCFAGWAAALYIQGGVLPAPGYFLSSPVWPYTLAVFGLFRLFDVAKPWPVRQSQSLPGGWGVTVDDLLAAGYVNLCVLVFAWASSGF